MESKKQSIYLFNEDNPKGQVFKFIGGKESEQYKEMLEQGWQDSPAKLNLPKNDDTGLAMEQVENARPEDIVKLCESFGFIVLTPEQLKAEANKLIDAVVDLGDFTDEALIAEAEKRGLKAPEAEDAEFTEAEGGDLDSLMERFNSDPVELTKPELVKLGNETFSLGLRVNMKEDTLIEKIKAAL